MVWFALIFSGIYLFLVGYGWVGLKRLGSSQLLLAAYLVFFLLSYVGGALVPWWSSELPKGLELWFRAALFACFIGLLVAVPIIFTGDLVGVLFRFIKSAISRKPQGQVASPEFRSRRNFLSATAFSIGALPFSSLLVGIGGKYRYRIHRYELEFSNLPKAFDGYRIVQLSDLHLGSFEEVDSVTEGMNLVNEQQPDLLLFTGDMVNNLSIEAESYVETLRNLRAVDGKYAVLGNHDYATYNRDFSPEESRADVEKLIQIQARMGFDNLRNRAVRIERGGEYFHLVGVENWGTGRFLKAGDLDLATQGLESNRFTLLMSHDPSHWEAQVIQHHHPIDLTLSGHTHGFQFGIEIAGWQWSPAKFRYPQWAGMYEKNGRLINVNRGFGFLGYPGRFGIWPEITVIQLKSAKKNT